MTQREESDTAKRPRAPRGKVKLDEMLIQVRYMSLWVELVTVANEMVKRGEAATIVAALGSMLGALEAERERIIALAHEIKEAVR